MVPPRDLWRGGSCLRLQFELPTTQGAFTHQDDYRFVDPMNAAISGLLEFLYPAQRAFCHDCLLTILELYKNSVQHGNKNDPQAMVWIELHWYPHQLLIGIRDTGNFYQLPSTKTALEAKRAIPTSRVGETGGMGLPIILNFAEKIAVNLAQNTLWLLIDCPVGAVSEASKAAWEAHR